MQEAAVMLKMRHPNVLGILGVCISPPALVNEYCTRGSLYDVMREARASPALGRQLGWQRRLKLVSRAAPGTLCLRIP